MLFNRFVQTKTTTTNFTRYGEQQPSAKEIKCGLGLINSVVTNMSRFSTEQQVILKKLLDRPILQTSIVSGSGRFRVHFDTTGYNVPAYDEQLSPLENAIKVTEAADSAYNFEVNYLGFLPPPGDYGTGGDDLYDIYLTYSGFYGRTTPEDFIDENIPTYTSYIDMDPSFTASGFATHGLKAMRVTVAHELHHAIQIGRYINRYETDGYFYEMTSTSMEEFVFDDVNDYYAYMDDYFDNPARPFVRNNAFQGDGYDIAIWNIFLENKFGKDIFRKQWDFMPTVRAIYAINNSLQEEETSFRKEFNQFAIWMFYTSYRAISGKYFEEAIEYPPINPISVVELISPYTTVNGSALTTSQNYVVYSAAGGNDSLTAIISNGDVQSAVGNLNTDFDYSYTLFPDSSSGTRFLTVNYSSNFVVSNPSFWAVSEILNNLVVREDDAPFTPPAGGTFAFPNPFSYSESSTQYINFSFDGNSGETVDFNIYTSAMNLIYSENSIPIRPLANNSLGVTWNVVGNDNKKLNSGVYIYVIKKGDEVIKGKLVILN